MDENLQREREEEKKNKDFVQIYRSYIEQIAELGTNHPTALKLLLFLIKHMDGTNALCVSNMALQEVLQLSKPTICKAVKTLREEGWIDVLKSGKANIYIVNPEVAWTSYGYQKQYCKFQANVFISQTENMEYLKNRKAFNKFKTLDYEFVRQYHEQQEERLMERERINGTTEEE